MKRYLLIFAVSLFLFASASLGQQQNQPVKLGKISEGLYQVLDGRGATGGVYIGENGVLVIDSKMDKASVDQTIEEIKKVIDKPIKFLVNTHSDGDHVAGNKFFPQSVVFISQENCRKEMLLPGRGGAPSEWTKPELMPFLPAITFRDKMDIFLGSKKVELWYFGVGHTTGDAVVYFPEEKVVFLGDQLFLTRPQLIHSYKGGNSFEHVKTLTKMLVAIDAEKFCSGHSEMADRAAVKKHIEEIKQIQEKIKSLAKQNKTIDEIKKEFEQNQSALVESIYNELKTIK